MADKGGETYRTRSFRAVLLDAAGRPETTIAILAASEAEALDQARDLSRLYAVELWDGGRLIARIPIRQPG